MKKKNLVLMLPFLTFLGSIFAQQSIPTPLGVPYNIGNQTSTPDNEISVSQAGSPPFHYVPNCSSCSSDEGYFIQYPPNNHTLPPNCVFDNILRTGNDFQYFRPNFPDVSELEFKAIAWDSDCPSFSIVSREPTGAYNFDAAFVVKLNGNRFGDVSDPDIIISQQHVGETQVAIVIVYELTISNEKSIAYEQWNLDYLDKTIQLVTPINNANIISTTIPANNPNIDANNRNQLAVTFEQGVSIWSYIDYISLNTTLNVKDIINCGVDGDKPDVSISDLAFDPVVSYVFQQGSCNLVVIQEEFNNLIGTTSIANPYSHWEDIPDYKNPRIASPTSHDIGGKWEYAVVGVSCNDKEISVFSNHTGTMETYNNINGTILDDTPCNSMPSITYTGNKVSSGKTVAVAWTYNTDCISQTRALDVYSANVDLQTFVRTPSDPYVMAVHLDQVGNQYASSLSGRGASVDVHNDGDVFYSVGSNYTSGSTTVNKIVYKVSNTNLQPLLRKKSSDEMDNISEVIVYPNPSNGKFTIDLSSLEVEQFSISISNIEGKTVFNKAVADKKVLNIELSKFGSGIYILEINANNKLIREKLVIR